MLIDSDQDSKDSKEIEEYVDTSLQPGVNMSLEGMLDFGIEIIEEAPQQGSQEKLEMLAKVGVDISEETNLIREIVVWKGKSSRT